MTYQDVLAAARTCSGPYCKACPVCNGRACGSTMPGPGSKGTGTVAVRNYEAWQSLCLNMDTICENKPVDTRFSFFGETYQLPVFAGPVGAVNLHYGDKFNDMEYNNILVPACADAGIAAFTGDGTNPDVFTAAAAAIGAAGGRGIPTVKPWDRDTLYAKLDSAKASGAKVFAMDIDAAGLPFLSEGRSFGPHGTGLTIANSVEHYDEALSQELTHLTVTANLKMREIGFKPYVAPALSSGALSLLLTLRGEWHCGSVFLDGVYMGVKNRYTPAGIETELLPHIPDSLFAHIRDAAEHLKEIL